MASISELKRGKTIIFRDEPYTILEMHHIKDAMRKAYFKVKMRHLKTGNTLEYTFKAGEKIVDADVIHKKIQYTYEDDNFLYFMDENYDQLLLSKDIVGDLKQYLLEGTEVDGVFLNGEIINIIMPIKLNFKVTQAPPGVKGDTVSGGTKPVVIETGATIQAPLFIKEGDIVRINTETGEYVERVTS